MISAQDVKLLREKTGAGMLDCKKALEKTNGDIDKAVDFLREKGLAKAASKQTRIAADGLANIVIDKNVAVVYELNSETDFVAKNENFKELVEKVGKALLNSDVNNEEEALELLLDGKQIKEHLLELTAKIGEKITLRRVKRVVKQDDEVFGRYIHMNGKIVVLTVLKSNDEEVAKKVAMQVCASKPQYLSRDEISEETREHEKQILTQQALNEGKPIQIVEKMVIGRLNKYFEEICLVDQEFFLDSDKKVGEYLKSQNSSIRLYVRFEVGEGIEKKQENFADEVNAQIQGQK